MSRGIIWEEDNRYGKLVVVAYDKTTTQGVKWHCRCDCGKRHTTYGKSLRAGRVRSCGCEQGFSGEEAFYEALSRTKSPCDKGCVAWETCRQDELACQPFANYAKFGWDTKGNPDKFPPTRAQYRKLFNDKQSNER